MERPTYIYVDVDETFVRNYGAKQMPIPSVIEHIKKLKAEGAVMYCWSSGGAAYARGAAEMCRIADCFEDFLPKPQVLIDDVAITNWRLLLEVHPNSVHNQTLENYRNRLYNYRAR